MLPFGFAKGKQIYTGNPFGIFGKAPAHLSTSNAQGIKDEWSVSGLLKAIDTATHLEKSLLPTGQFLIDERTGKATALKEHRTRTRRPKVVIPLFNGDLEDVEQIPGIPATAGYHLDQHHAEGHGAAAAAATHGARQGQARLLPDEQQDRKRHLDLFDDIVHVDDIVGYVKRGTKKAKPADA